MKQEGLNEFGTNFKEIKFLFNFSKDKQIQLLVASPSHALFFYNKKTIKSHFPLRLLQNKTKTI